MKYVIILSLTFYSAVLYSQTAPLSDPKRLNDSARHYLDISDFEKALKFAQLAKSYAEDLKSTEELAQSHLTLGNIKMREGHLREAQQFYSKSIHFAKECRNTNLQAKALSNFASMLSQLGQYDSAELLIEETLKLKDIDKSILIS